MTEPAHVTVTSQAALRAAQDKAMATGRSTIIDFGRVVICDGCDEDLTADTRSGGFMNRTHATGPCCAARTETELAAAGRLADIRDRCPEGVAFADWVRAMRPDGGRVEMLFNGPPGAPLGTIMYRDLDSGELEAVVALRPETER